MIIKKLEQMTMAEKIKFTLHLAGLGFFLRWITQIGPIYLFIVVPSLALIQHKYAKQPIDGYRSFWRDLLLMLLVFAYGVGALWNFVGHFFMTEMVANSIGWEKSPFQIELAGYHLAFSLISLLALWNRNPGYWGAVVHSMAIFLFSAGAVHIYEMIKYQNYNYGNASFPILVGTTLYPAAVILVYWKFRSSNKIYEREKAGN